MLYWNKLFNYLCIFSSIKYTKKKKKRQDIQVRFCLGLFGVIVPNPWVVGWIFTFFPQMLRNLKAELKVNCVFPERKVLLTFPYFLSASHVWHLILQSPGYPEWCSSERGYVSRCYRPATVSGVLHPV